FLGGGSVLLAGFLHGGTGRRGHLRGARLRLLGGLAHRLRGLGAGLSRLVDGLVRLSASFLKGVGLLLSASGEGQRRRQGDGCRPTEDTTRADVHRSLLIRPCDRLDPGRRWISSRKAARRKYDDPCRNATDQPTAPSRKPRLRTRKRKNSKAGRTKSPTTLPRAPRSYRSSAPRRA